MKRSKENLIDKDRFEVKILIDNQVYENQKFGGISRYFNELRSCYGIVEGMLPYEQQPLEKMDIFSKFRSKINPSKIGNRPTFPNRYDFYKTQLRERDFNLFHPTYYDNYFLKELQKPFVITVHDMIHEKYAEYFGNSKDSINKRNLCEAAEKIIAISKTTKTDIVEIFGIREDKIEVIYHATNFTSIPSVKPDLDFQDKSYLLYTGTRSIYKNFLFFLMAVTPIILERKELNLICTGPTFNEVEVRWIRDLGLEKRVMHYFCKNDNELVYLYEHAECFVFPSLYEGFGLPLLEAFACGCPVVTSPGGSLKEVAAGAALYFDPKDIRSIRKSIREVLEDPSLRKELKKAGEKRLNFFSWEKCREETLQVYSQVLSK